MLFVGELRAIPVPARRRHDRPADGVLDLRDRAGADRPARPGPGRAGRRRGAQRPDQRRPAPGDAVQHRPVPADPLRHPDHLLPGHRPRPLQPQHRLPRGRHPGRPARQRRLLLRQQRPRRDRRRAGRRHPRAARARRGRPVPAGHLEHPARPGTGRRARRHLLGVHAAAARAADPRCAQQRADVVAPSARGDARLAHRPAEPRAAAQPCPEGAGDGGRVAPGRGHAYRPGPLQGDQRHHGSPRR